MEKIIRFNRGYDCKNFECIHKSSRCKPGSGGFHGVHGLEILFILKGPEGAVQFLLETGWLPQFIEPSKFTFDRYIKDCGIDGIGAMPFDLGYHSKKPMYDNQNQMSDNCECCDGQPCYYDGSGLNAYDAMYALVNGGDEALWEFLDGYYYHIFYKKEYPKPAEYPMKLRSRENDCE